MRKCGSWLAYNRTTGKLALATTANQDTLLQARARGEEDK